MESDGNPMENQREPKAREHAQRMKNANLCQSAGFIRADYGGGAERLNRFHVLHETIFLCHAFRDECKR